MWFSGFIVGVFLMVGDELISLSLYCGEKCEYPYPLIGSYPIWQAWEIAFGSMLAGILLSFLVLTSTPIRDS